MSKKLLIAALLLGLAWLLFMSGTLRSTVPGPRPSADPPSATGPSLAEHLDRAGALALGQRAPAASPSAPRGNPPAAPPEEARTPQ